MVAATATLFYFEHLVTAIVLCILTVMVATLALTAPERLQAFQEMGKRAGVWVGNGVGVLMLTRVLFILFVPVSLLLRTARIDLLRRRFSTRGKTNWLDRIDYGEDKRLYKKSYTRPYTSDRS